MSLLAKRNETTPAAAVERVQYVTPAVNLHQDAEGYVLELEMPGVSREGVEIMVNDGQLTIVGRRNADQPKGHSVYAERRSADYRRVFDLDPGIDTSKTSAAIEQGLLTVRLPKVEAAKPRKIEVK